MRDHHLPLPGPTHRRPHHPRRPPNPATDRRHLAVGHRHLPGMATTTSRLPLTASPPAHPTPGTPPRPRKPPPPAPPAPPSPPPRPNQPHHPPRTPTTP